MKTYYFYDSDWNYGGKGDVEYHIQGEEFRKLLEVCFRYSAYVAFSFSPSSEAKYLQLLAPFEESVPDVISSQAYPPKRMWPTETFRCFNGRTVTTTIQKSSTNRFYRTCPELIDVLCSVSDSIFTYLDGWGYCNPEDPTFYRADGSVFFSSVIHEGECKLTPRDDEDISEIIRNPLWVCDNG